MGTPYESKEYDRLKRRKFAPYSAGHQAMYNLAIAEIALDLATAPVKRADIFEAGFGIGFGLGQMLAAEIVSTYIGCEPNLDSFTYTALTEERRGPPKHGAVWLKHEPLSNTLVDRLFQDEVLPADYAFCIEVIEHVAMADHLAFLQTLRRVAPRLYFSTPDIVRVPKEGVRTTGEWLQLLARAGFKDVQVVKDHWTYLYKCR